MKYLSVLLFAFIGMQCSPKLSPDHNWGDKNWVLVEMKGVPVQQSESRRDASISFIISEKRFTGYGGCNEINGKYILEKDKIHFTEVLVTKRSCNDIEFENVFVTTLNDIEQYEERGNELLLKNYNGVMLVFRMR